MPATRTVENLFVVICILECVTRHNNSNVLNSLNLRCKIFDANGTLDVLFGYDVTFV